MTYYRDFDWSELDRKTITRHIRNISPLVKDKKLGVGKLHSLLSKNIKSLAPVKIKKIYSTQVENGSVYIGGCYQSADDQDNEKCIEISLNYFSKNDKIEVYDQRLKRIAICIADTLLHEIMHMRQYRRRAFKPLPDYASRAEKTDIRKEQAYLGCTDEIDAYAFNIACELYEKFKGNEKEIVNYLNKPLKHSRYNNCWRMYLKAFEYNHNHSIIKRLKKKIIYYLPAAQIGKPYKSKDWINW